MIARETGRVNCADYTRLHIAELSELALRVCGEIFDTNRTSALVRALFEVRVRLVSAMLTAVRKPLESACMRPRLLLMYILYIMHT